MKSKNIYFFQNSSIEGWFPQNRFKFRQDPYVFPLINRSYTSFRLELVW